MALLFAVFSVYMMIKCTVCASDGFVSTSGNKFTLNGKPYYFAGANCYNLFTYGSGAGDTETQYMNKQQIDEMMQIMQSNKVEVVRTWGFNTQTWHGFETKPNVYNEQEFDEFDYIALSAKNHNIKLIVTLTNYWTDYGGISQYLEWAGSSAKPNQGVFFSDTKAIQLYKNYVEYFIERKNHYTNISYINDTTIFAWEVCNEPRHQNLGDDITSTVLRKWMDNIGQFIKNIDPNHLISSGLEGQGSKYGYGGNDGNDFITIHQSTGIDFCSAHPYPTESWAELNISQTQRLISQWIYDCQVTVGKPMFIGEFNTLSYNEEGHTRSEWWQAIYEVIENENAGGDAFWWFQYNDYDPNYGVNNGDAELKVFQQHSINMQKKSG